MKIFMSALEGQEKVLDALLERGVKLKYNLMSFAYIGKNTRVAEKIKENSELVIIDSGAHTFQKKGTEMDWDKYTQEYAEFIKKYDDDKVVGYFEMDVDNIIGYDKVLELRAVLEEVTDKVIPVWHKSRGVEEFKTMCQEYAGRTVAVTGFKNEDIKDDQYLSFLKYAKKYGCKLHCLGMTRRKLLDKVPFDYTDASTWCQQSIYGMSYTSGLKFPRATGQDKINQLAFNYIEGIELQKKYEEKWRKYD